jgi:hypothetical protein
MNSPQLAHFRVPTAINDGPKLMDMIKILPTAKFVCLDFVQESHTRPPSEDLDSYAIEVRLQGLFSKSLSG